MPGNLYLFFIFSLFYRKGFSDLRFVSFVFFFVYFVVKNFSFLGLFYFSNSLEYNYSAPIINIIGKDANGETSFNPNIFQSVSQH